MSIYTKELALSFADDLIEKIQDIASVAGSHYAPDLRDYLEDHKSWVREVIATEVEEIWG